MKGCKYIVIGLLLAMSMSARAAVDTKKYAKCFDEISETIRTDVNHPKKMVKAMEEITRNGDVVQSWSVGMLLSRVDAFTVDSAARDTYKNMAKELIIHMLTLEPELDALADGRKPIGLEEASFYPTFYPQWKLAEMLSLLSDVCSVISTLYGAHEKPEARPMFEQFWRLRGHYIEKTIYGDDHYATKVLGSSVDPAFIQTLKDLLGTDIFIEQPYQFYTSLNSVASTKQQEIFAATEAIITYCSYYLSVIDQNLCGTVLTHNSLVLGKSDEDSRIRAEVEQKLAPLFATHAQGVLAAAKARNSEGVDKIAAFFAYQDQLREDGKLFVNYPPAQCPVEYADDPEYITYTDLYARVGYLICQEVSQLSTQASLNNNSAEIRNVLQRMGYTDTHIAWTDRFVVYVCDLLENTLYLYYNTHAAWTIGAIVSETRLLIDLLSVSPLDAITYELAVTIPFLALDFGNEDLARLIMDEYIIPFLPKANLRSLDMDQNCFYMDLYTKVIQFLSLYEEPRRSELEQIYVKRFEQALKANAACPWHHEHVAALLGYYFDKKDVAKVHKYTNEYLALTGDTVFVNAYLYHLYGGIEKDFVKAASYLNQINEADSTTAAFWSEYSGLNPAYTYARINDKAKAEQQLRIFDDYMRKKFTQQLMTVGGEQAGQLLKQYEGINDFFVQANDEIENADIRAGFLKEFYNWQLFSKGLLLALNKESEQILENHPSPMVRELYKQLSDMETQLSTMTNRESFDAQMLQSNIDAVRNNLMQTIRAYVDENNVSAVHMTSWSDVRDALQPHEAAIEIVFGKLEDDTINTYYALLLRHGDQAPVAVRLCTEPELTRLTNGRREPATIDALYQFGRDGKKMTQLVWTHILPYLQEGDRIYFSASGVLHQVAVEALPLDAKQTMIDKYDVVRVSSTREVTRKELKNEGVKELEKSKATLYGGIQYDATPTELSKESSRYPLLAKRSMESTDTLNRGRALYLPGTQKEIEQIAQTLTDKATTVKTYSSVAANEESFKALSGSNQNILHLATHGFYWPLQAAQSMSELNQYSVQYLTDPLNRCGLLFAGANTALSGHSDRLAPGVQDGILTAKEISLLDFTGTDIVVLSACETGLGDVTSEGVFGLQRAFKMAGAQTMLMALWQVNDEATRMLMTAFYLHYTAGESKREAFRNAQQEVRSSKYKSPYFWAGFILLD